MSNFSDQDRSPVFLQFVDCVFQLLHLCPCAFEFNELLLCDLVDAVYACHFGTFLLNSERERLEANIASRTASFWSSVEQKRASRIYENVFYDRSDAADFVILPKVDFLSVRVFPYYLRYFTPRPKDAARPVIESRSIEEAYRILMAENERLKKQMGK